MIILCYSQISIKEIILPKQAVKKAAYFLGWLAVTGVLFCIGSLGSEWDDKTFKKIDKDAKKKKN